MILGDLGAEVIKVEPPGGSDDTRHWGPPFQNDVSAYYLCANRNKKSLTLDLKSEEGRAVIKELVKESDVIIHNFKTGTMERFGLDYEVLRDVNPKIVYCSITGFGETGPYKDLPGYDFIIQAMSGLMSITGDQMSGPQKVGVAITDVLTGLYACIGIQSALLERSKSNLGQKLDISLYDTAVSSLVNVASNYLMSGSLPERMGNSHPNIVPYQAFQTKDSEMVVAVGNDSQFGKLCQVLNLPKLSSNPKFRTNSDRVANREELTKILQAVFSSKSNHFWVAELRKTGVPCGSIQDFEELTNDPQLQARHMFVDMPHPKAGDIKMVGNPINLSRTPVEYKLHPPEVGEHSDMVLSSINFLKENPKMN